MGIFRRSETKKAERIAAREDKAEQRREVAEQRTLASAARAAESAKRRKTAAYQRRAEDAGMVHRSEYLSPEEEKARVTLNSDGLPTARLTRERDRLLLKTDSGGWVNPKSTQTYRLGIYSFQIRGTSHYEAAVKAGRFTPGAPVRLVREPDNPHDPNAVAVYAEKGRSVAGYINKANAARVARLMDSGIEMVAVSMRGGAAGKDATVPHILVCERRIMEHLLRP